MGSKENWDEGKKLMNEPKSFIDSLVNYDKDHIPQKTLNKLYNTYIKQAGFNAEAMSKK